MLLEIEAFLRWVRIRSPQARTWRDYRCDLGLFVSLMGDREAGGILPGDVDRFVSQQLAHGCKASTINRRLAAVVSFYRYLAAQGSAVPCPVLPRRHYLREPQRLPRPVGEQELQRFFAAIGDVRDRAMFTLMLHCGLRIGEVSGLKLQDLYLGERPARLILPGKGARERTVYLSETAGQALEDWLAGRPAARDEHVFLSYQQKKLSTTSISKRVQRACRASGVRLTAHRLRHSFADHLLSAGMPITSIQKLMGHRFVETTQNYAAANDRQVQADFYQACRQLDGWNLHGESGGSFEGWHTGQAEEQVEQAQTRVPACIAHLPAGLGKQLEAYRGWKASRWRVERVTANSIGFYSLHGRMWAFFCGECGVRTVSDLRLDHVLQWIQARLNAGRSPRTVNGSLSSLRTFLGFLQEDGVEIHPSLEHLRRLKEPDRLPRYISSAQVLRLQSRLEEEVQQAASREERQDASLLRAAFYLLWQGGLRSGEVELLRFSDFHIPAAGPARRLFIRDGKWRKGRTVYLTDVTLQALQEYLAVRGVVQGSDFVFVRNGKPLRKNFLSGRLKQAGRQVEVSVTPHRLRHTFATQLLNVGCRITSIQKLLGHSHLNTTMLYARAFDQTVMQDYFRALAILEGQPEGAWFGLQKTPAPET